MYRDPQVTLQVLEAATQTVTVTGEAHAIIPVTGVRHLLDILAAAGGLPPTASHTITIDRPGVDQPIVVDLGTDPCTAPRPTSPSTPATPSSSPASASSTCSASSRPPAPSPSSRTPPSLCSRPPHSAAAPLFNGNFNDLRILRTVNRHAPSSTSTSRSIMQGKAPDPVLQADDILFLPSSPAKAAISSGGLGVLLNLVSVLLIAANY